MKTHFIKVALVIVVIIFGLTHKSFSQTAFDSVDSESSNTISEKLSKKSLLHFENSVKIDSLNFTETKDTLPNETFRIVNKVSHIHRCIDRIVSPPVSIFLFDPESTIKRYSSKDILRYRF